MPTQQIDTVIIGGGQAGLSTSYWLKQHGAAHIILEKSNAPGSAWRQRWDSFTLVTPNWSFQLPGSAYGQAAPHGYMNRDQILAAFADYARHHQLPVHYGCEVTTVAQTPNRQDYRVTLANGSTIEAANVMLATGSFQQPKLPSFAAALPNHILQLHSGQYRNPAALPPGAVLVVGSGQSGAQITEELYQHGRTVYLCVGSAGRAPRHYRGRDTWEWLSLCGFLDRMADKLPSPQARFAANPHISGRDGGHTLNLHQFARDGVRLLGRLVATGEGTISLAPDLHESLARADQFEMRLVALIDDYIDRSGLDIPAELLPRLDDGLATPIVRELDLNAAGITTVIWALGYTFDFSLVRLPILDAYGYPIQQRGVTAFPGLYFVGLNWLHTQKSGLLQGVGDDAAAVVTHLVATGRRVSAQT
jgi:putative flavoprotein involved in K+ transport